MIRVLFISRYPGPPLHGGNIYINNILNNLDKWITISMVYYLDYEDDDNNRNEYLTSTWSCLDEVTGVKCLVPLTHWQRLRGLASSLPPGVYYTTHAVGHRICEVAAELVSRGKVDIIHLWSANLAHSLKDISQVPKILTCGDSFSLIHKSYARRKKFPLNMYHHLVSSRFIRYEQSVYPYYQIVVFFSERDRKSANLSAEIRQLVIPNGVNSSLFTPKNILKKNEKPILAFHGDFIGNYANIEAARFIIDRIGPRLSAFLGNNGFVIQIFGIGAENILQGIDFPWLEVHGYIDNIVEKLSQADIYLAPIFSGAGIKNKVLEAMACGLPVIGTREAFEALAVKNHSHCIISNIETFTDHVVKLVEDNATRISIGLNARKLMVDKYSWKSVARRYCQLYEELLT
ncbi:MAG: glycosyltransferase [Firmicutes bacterium]|nr:glycosyltransferase [Bacillota bacterium]